jgi:hypothetical protein
MYSKTSKAVGRRLGAGVERAESPETNQRKGRGTDPLDTRLWQTMLSADPRISARKRLQAFETLEKAGGFRRCTCGGPEPKFLLSEEKLDSALAYIVRVAGGRHYRAAANAAEFPETYLAVRDAIDAAVRSERGHG